VETKWAAIKSRSEGGGDKQVDKRSSTQVNRGRKEKKREETTEENGNRIGSPKSQKKLVNRKKERMFHERGSRARGYPTEEKK
jgi:hypothetical protein